MTRSARKVIFLGALSAVAEAAARKYASEGAEIMLAGRDPNRLLQVAQDLSVRGARRVETVALNLATANAETESARMIHALGGVDDVVLAYGILGAHVDAEVDLSHAAEIIDVDFRSPALWCLAFASRLEAQKHGNLVVIGSVAGDRGRASNYVYGAAKGGLAVLVQGLAHRLARSGARAVIVKPGFIDTPMTVGHKKGPLWAKPAVIGAIVRRAADRGGPVIYAPSFWRYIMLLVRSLPSVLFHRTKL